MPLVTRGTPIDGELTTKLDDFQKELTKQFKRGARPYTEKELFSDIAIPYEYEPLKKIRLDLLTLIRGYVRHHVAPDESCWQNALGISCRGAISLFMENIDSVHELLTPAISEELVKKEFYDYLINKNHIEASRTHEEIKENLSGYSTVASVVEGYLHYSICDRDIQIHHRVFQAWAEIHHLELRMWSLSECFLLHHHSSCPVYIPETVDYRMDLLFTADNRFEKIDIFEYKNGGLSKAVCQGDSLDMQISDEDALYYMDSMAIVLYESYLNVSLGKNTNNNDPSKKIEICLTLIECYSTMLNRSTAWDNEAEETPLLKKKAIHLHTLANLRKDPDDYRSLAETYKKVSDNNKPLALNDERDMLVYFKLFAETLVTIAEHEQDANKKALGFNRASQAYGDLLTCNENIVQQGYIDVQKTEALVVDLLVKAQNTRDPKNRIDGIKHSPSANNVSHDLSEYFDNIWEAFYHVKGSFLRAGSYNLDAEAFLRALIEFSHKANDSARNTKSAQVTQFYDEALAQQFNGNNKTLKKCCDKLCKSNIKLFMNTLAVVNVLAKGEDKEEDNEWGFLSTSCNTMFYLSDRFFTLCQDWILKHKYRKKQEVEKIFNYETPVNVLPGGARSETCVLDEIETSESYMDDIRLVAAAMLNNRSRLIEVPTDCERCALCLLNDPSQMTDDMGVGVYLFDRGTLLSGKANIISYIYRTLKTTDYNGVTYSDTSNLIGSCRFKEFPEIFKKLKQELQARKEAGCVAPIDLYDKLTSTECGAVIGEVTLGRELPRRSPSRRVSRTFL